MPTEAHREKPLVIGILGGVASGKTHIARMLAELAPDLGPEAASVSTIVADDIVRSLLEEPEIVKAIREEFGEGVLDADGQVDRAALGKLAFGDGKALDRLEAILHPPVTMAIRERMARSTAGEVIVLDVPLLTESPFLEEIDVLVFVDTPEALRVERARASRGWPPEEVARRERHQTPLEKKREMARFTIPSGGSQQETSDGARRVLSTILKEWKGKRSTDTA